MYSFGKIPPRSLKSFGVSGLLGQSCFVLYTNIFSTRHIGKVADLIGSQLRKAGLDELRFRSLLLFSAFEAYRNQADSIGRSNGESLAEPLVIECGVDDEKLAIGVSFSLAIDSGFAAEGANERIAKIDPASADLKGIDGLLRRLQLYGDQVVVRSLVSKNRMEIVALLGLTGKVEGALAPRPVELVMIEEADAAAETPKPETYLELGDVDYATLLQDEGPGQELPPPATGQVLAETFEDIVVKSAPVPHADETETVVKGSPEPVDDTETVVKGSPELADDTETLVKGSPEPIDDTETLVKGTGEKSPDQTEHLVKGVDEEKDDFEKRIAGDGPIKRDQTVFKVSGGAPQGPAGREMNVKISGGAPAGPAGREMNVKISGTSASDQGADDEMIVNGSDPAEPDDKGSDLLLRGPDQPPQFYKDRIEDLERRLARAKEANLQMRQRLSQSTASASNEKIVVGGGSEFAAQDETEIAVKGRKEDAQVLDREARLVSAAEQDKKDREEREKSDAEDAAMLGQLKDMGADKALSKVQAEFDSLKAELVDSPKAKKMVEGMMGEILAEKARLNEATSKLNLTLRQKQLEFRNKETLLKQEVRQRDEQLRIKGTQVDRLREQMENLRSNMERLKSGEGGGSSTGEEKELKSKLSMTSTMLQKAKEENVAQARKVEELKNQVMALQQSTKKAGTPATELVEIKAKYDRTLRQCEEFKKANQQLMERLNEKDKKKDAKAAASGSPEELKKKLEAAVRLAATKEKDAEKLQLKVEEMMKEEARLRAELNKAQAEMKTLARGGGAAPAAPGTTPPGGKKAA